VTVRSLRFGIVCATVYFHSNLTSAQPAPARNTAQPTLSATGFVEAYYNFNFNRPGNRINHFRYFDSRYDQVSLNNAGVTLEGSVGQVSGRTTLMFGSILEAFPPSEDPANELLWKVLAEANVAWRTPVLGEDHPLTLEAGLFVTPFGPENFAVHDNWSWSPSNIFSILPFQLTGARLGLRLLPTLTVRGGIYSGWDQVLQDRNGFRTGLFSLEYDRGELGYAGLSYMVGVERADTDREGPWTRHSIDAFGEYAITSRVSVRAHFFGGIEPNRLGLTAWAAGALYARVKIFPWMAFAVRGDLVREWVPTGSASLFLTPRARGVSTFGSATATLDIRPHRNLAFMIEYRHDHADGSFYYRDVVRGMRDPRTGTVSYTLNAPSQDTLLAGATAWF
jgi:hypothetical protein